MFTWFKNNPAALAAVFATVTLGACSGSQTVNSRSLAVVHEGLKAPAGTKKITEAVDGLTVGHRLMASKEYELALKAYTRAAAEKGLNADVLSALGSANMHLGRLHHANELLQLAVKKDPDFVPAWNNLGVVLMSQGEYAEAKRVFQLAYGLDNGSSEEIRKNLTKVIAIMDNREYSSPNTNNDFELVRRGNGKYLLLSTSNSG
ncbi:MAG: tetratricopeptide repeat protein [Rhodobacteraceae bacterium]|nr:tetratricopeptide repeat protein [Paracoccaceae bacterium]